jgi:hypothetical protein
MGQVDLTKAIANILLVDGENRSDLLLQWLI